MIEPQEPIPDNDLAYNEIRRQRDLDRMAYMAGEAEWEARWSRLIAELKAVLPEEGKEQRWSLLLSSIIDEYERGSDEVRCGVRDATVLILDRYDRSSDE